LERRYFFKRHESRRGLFGNRKGTSLVGVGRGANRRKKGEERMRGVNMIRVHYVNVRRCQNKIKVYLTDIMGSVSPLEITEY
jgi:hypothetical protein